MPTAQLPGPQAYDWSDSNWKLGVFTAGLVTSTTFRLGAARVGFRRWVLGIGSVMRLGNRRHRWRCRVGVRRRLCRIGDMSLGARFRGSRCPDLWGGVYRTTR